MPNATGYEYFEYDAENRLVRAATGGEPWVRYRYGLDNRRLWRARQQGPGNRTEQAFFYGAYGELLDGGRIYFGGRLIGRGGYVGEATLTDRLGSVGGPSKYYPYGQERQPTYQDTEKFATYYRDATGLDYAWNRHYTSTWGRFMQADPYVSPDALKNPQGWNRYAYVENDPVNGSDAAGLFTLPASQPTSPTEFKFSITVTPYALGSQAMEFLASQSFRTMMHMAELANNALPVPAIFLRIFEAEPPVVKVRNLAKSGTKYDMVLARMQDVLNTIDPDCLAFLESGGPACRATSQICLGITSWRSQTSSPRTRHSRAPGVVIFFRVRLRWL